MTRILLQDAQIINESKTTLGHILVNGERIEKVFTKNEESQLGDTFLENIPVINLKGKTIIPGVIDDQVHFREPGLTHKGNIYTEAKAAVAGGVTSFMEMPNTDPQTTNFEELENKLEIASKNALANYSFYFGATNDNADLVANVDPSHVCGVKVFMGSSTGNMLVDKEEALEKIFKVSKLLIATHCEDEKTVRTNLERYKKEYGDNVPYHLHPVIRSAEACYKSSSKAVALAKKHGARLHVLHISTAKELELFEQSLDVQSKRITAEACIHHLFFSDEDYTKRQQWIKWNPAVKTKEDRRAIQNALLNGVIDVIATDHAPHTKEEKLSPYVNCPSGGPLIQHSLLAMWLLSRQGVLSKERMVELMSHNPAKLFEIKHRGFIREGYFADLVVVDEQEKTVVNPSNILYKCGWSPFEGIEFPAKIHQTWVNGNLVYDQGVLHENIKGRALEFER